MLKTYTKSLFVNMLGLIDLARRIWSFLNPPQRAKSANAIRFGLLGASKIAPIALINPAKSHDEAMIAAVAARDVERATSYARKYNIPIVHNSYQELLDDTAIDAVYIALPNGLHYEWTIKAIKAGKHVLLEKPSVSNSADADALFHHPLLVKPHAPVVLEAFHVRFHPAFQHFLSLLDSPNIAACHASMHLFRGVIPPDDIRFKYDLSGGTLMDLGTYMCMCLRQMMKSEPNECSEAKMTLLDPKYDQKCERAVTAQWRWTNGARGNIDVDLSARGGYWCSWLTSGWPSLRWPVCEATHKYEVVADDHIEKDDEHIMVRTVRIWNFMVPQIWHRISIVDKHTIRKAADKREVVSWEEKQTQRKYGGVDETAGEIHWSTYRYQLEAFVNKVRGRSISVWVDGEDSIKQMKMIDSAYLKAGLPVRPSSTFAG